jgi:hypothetical protein
VKSACTVAADANSHRSETYLYRGSRIDAEQLRDSTAPDLLTAEKKRQEKREWLTQRFRELPEASDRPHFAIHDNPIPVQPGEVEPIQRRFRPRAGDDDSGVNGQVPKIHFIIEQAIVELQLQEEEIVGWKRGTRPFQIVDPRQNRNVDRFRRTMGKGNIDCDYRPCDRNRPMRPFRNRSG